MLHGNMANNVPLLAKTEISEMAPRPTPLTFSLLQQIYAAGGPVQKTYKKYGIQYQNTEFLVLQKNELWVDKEKEIKSLLPSYSCLKSPDQSPKMVTLRGFFTTFKNIFSLQKISAKNPEQTFTLLKNELEKKSSFSSIQEFLPDFLKTYEIIFETNLLSGIAVKKLEFILKKENIKSTEVVKNSFLFCKNQKNFSLPSLQNEVGNSIEISDESPFVSHSFEKKEPDSNIQQWWNGLPEWKKRYLEPTFSHAILFLRLREYSRWLIVKKIHELRQLVLETADTLEFSLSKNIYFCTLEEIMAGTAQEAVALQRKKLYATNPGHSFPASSSLKPQGVASGQATGVLCTTSTLDSSQASILFTELLTPDLTIYFPQIKGIVSMQGSFLSHIAIVAREAGIPVIVHFSPSEEIKLGDKIFMDGDTGEIKKM